MTTVEGGYNETMEPLAVGLVGAGPWATMVHAPVIAAGPETGLTAVWARRPDAAATLAAAHGTTAAASFDELLDRSEAVAFAVAPGAQPDLAVRAAQAGKAVLLEKPLAETVDDARRIAEAVGEAGVGSIVMLIYRFTAGVRAFLDAAPRFGADGGRGWWFSGALLGGPFAVSRWRQAHGALLDIGPHLLDVVEGALGPVERVTGERSAHDWTAAVLSHRGGAQSEVTMTCRAAIADSRAGVDLFGPDGVLEVDFRRERGAEGLATLRAEFSAVARAPQRHPADVWRGLELQVLIDQVARGVKGR